MLTFDQIMERSEKNYNAKTDAIIDAVKARYAVLRPSLPSGTDHKAELVFNGHRTSADSIATFLGRKPEGNFAEHDLTVLTVEGLKAGKFDNIIIDTFMERAGAEYWYAYYKDYGTFDD